METETTISLAESADEILSLIKTREEILEIYKKDKIENHYLYMVTISLQIAIKNLADRVQSATR
jgi:hypothetical protein